MRRVSAYIAYMMLKRQDRHYIWAPYNFQLGSLDSFMIQPKNGVVTVFDSLDYDQSTYKEFILILQNLGNFSAYQHYITNGGIHNPKRPKEMVVRPRLCSSRLHEQQILNIGSDLCRFILREVVNLIGTYYHQEHELAQEDKYVSLCEWENQEYRQG
uniref:Uncharacterized protein n=1 Tax=Setaria viridis TaxID=4556 RepID=A0A4U6WFC4_SETVI|nr:hypothetical protein SEVIR_1G276100v2 [Setaria viridis]